MLGEVVGIASYGAHIILGHICVHPHLRLLVTSVWFIGSVLARTYNNLSWSKGCLGCFTWNENRNAAR